MDTKKVRLEYDVQRIEALKKLNDEFLLVKIYAMATGKNRNFTYISKEDVMAAIPSAYYCPVVGHIRTYIDDEGVEHVYMGSHDIDIDESWNVVDSTRPYGVIVENSEGWETINEHGTDVEYLTLNAILWTGRYPELNQAAYSDEILFNQSMEINITNYRPLVEDSNYWEVLGFTFSAFCLLGKADSNSTNGHTDKREHSEPAFISAKVVPYEFNMDEFKKEFALLKDKISQFSLTNETNDTTEGGNSMAEEINDVVDTAVTEFEEDSAEATEQVDEVLDEQSEEPIEEKEDAPVEENTLKEVTTDEATQEETAEEAIDYESLYNDTKEALDNLQAEFDEYRETHSVTDADYQLLVEYRDNRERDDRETAENELFSCFEANIGETDEYQTLRNSASEYSLDDLKMRLYAIVGMHANTQPQEKQKELIKFNLNSFEEHEEADPYGGAKEYYL